jgi:hypothetical protein
MRIGIRNATFLCTALALAFFMSSVRAHAAIPATAQAQLSTSVAGAKHVTLTVSFRTELRCGMLMGSRTVVLGLPAKAHVNGTVPAAAVKVGGRAASKVGVSGHTVTITLAPPRGMMCDSLRVGVLRIVIDGTAGIGNPASPGLYYVKVTHGVETLGAAFRIP